jgi:hypothetical protein
MKSLAQTIFVVFLGAILGGYLGALMGVLVPTGILHKIFVIGIPLGLSQPLVINLKVLVLTFGFRLFINLMSIVGMLIAYTTMR